MIKTANTPAAIGRRLELARIRANYKTRSAAARALNKPNSTYQGWENGSRGISPQIAEHIGRVFQCSPAWLLTGDESDIESPTGERPIPSMMVPVTGTVGNTGLLRLGSMQKPDITSIPAHVSQALSGYTLHAWQVLDDSIDREAPRARYVIGVLYEDLKRDPRPGELVLLEQTAGHEFFCRQIRMCVEGDDGIVFEPVSENDEHTPITIDPPSEPYLETKPLALIVSSSASHLPDDFEV